MYNYGFYKKIHRVLVIVMSLSTLLMAITGLLLKYSGLANALGVDMLLTRNLHNQASPVFSIVLLLMMTSGVMMYIIPLLLRRNK